MNRAVAELYAPDIITLATKPDTPRIPFKHEIFEEAVKWLHEQGRYSADMLADPHAHRLIEETYNALNGAIGASIAQETPEEMTYALRNNAFIFSGFKTHRTLSEVGLELTDDEGNLKPYAKVLEDVRRIDDKYNGAYLYAEYNHAVHTTQMAVKWQDFVRDGDEYNLQYRTAGDERVREAHLALDGVTLPPSDKFWDRYLPPNGWNCRCTVVQVLREDFPLSDSEEAIKRGDESTQTIKQQMFRFNPGKTLELFPPKHPYYKVTKEVKQVVEQVSAEEIKQRRIAELRQALPDNLTETEKDAIAANNYELEKAMGIVIGKRMSVDEADKQSANPAYVPRLIIDPAGMYRDQHYRYSINPAYNEKRDMPNAINCQTCAPAYALRLMGFKVTAKPNTKGSKLEYLSRGMNAWEVWRNPDGTPARHTSLNSWLDSKGYKKPTPKRYLEFFEEVCKDEGVYELSIAWKRGGGHATILQRFADGTLRYIEPQADNSAGSGFEWKDVEYLANAGATKNHECRGIMRVDNKLFNIAHIDIFDK